MKYLKIFENFEDNKVVVSTLEKILDCIKSGKKITSELNGGTLIDLHDKCSEKSVMEFLLKASEIAELEIKGENVNLKREFDTDKLEALITTLKANPEKSEPSGMKIESFSKFIYESHNKKISITEEEMNLFSQEPALEELINKSKITLKNKEVFFDENDDETRQLLDQYLEMPGKVVESFNENKIHIPMEYNAVRMELGLEDSDEANSDDIISLYNELVEEGTPLVSYSEYGTEGKFYNENDDEIPTDTILDELNYAIGLDDSEIHESITLKTIKKFNQFLNENIELSNSSARIYIDSDEADMFKTEPALQKLVSDRKVSLDNLPELWFESEDKNTIDILKGYFPDVEFNIEEDEDDDSEDFENYYY